MATVKKSIKVRDYFEVLPDDVVCEAVSDEQVTEPTDYIPLPLLISRLQSGKPTGLYPQNMVYSVAAGDENRVLDSDTMPDLRDKLDIHDYAQKRLKELRLKIKKIDEEKKEQKRKEYAEYLKWQENKKNIPPETPPAPPAPESKP